MANCPKCNCHLRLTDWKQICPNCGANIVIYDLQERLMKDADKAEVQYYHFQKKVDRLRGSFIGNKIAITRIFTSLLPVAAVFLPLVNGSFSSPLTPFEGKLSAISIYNMMQDFNFDVIKGLLAGDESKAAIAFVTSIAALVLSVFLLVVHFLCLMLACSKSAKPRGAVLNGLLIISTLTSLISFSAIPENSFVSGTLGLGAYLYLALMLVCCAVDCYLLFVKPIKITHSQCYVGAIPIEEYFEMQEKGVPQEEIREEMYRRLSEIQKQKEAQLADAEKEQKEEAKA